MYWRGRSSGACIQHTTVAYDGGDSMRQRRQQKQHTKQHTRPRCSVRHDCQLRHDCQPRCSVRHDCQLTAVCVPPQHVLKKVTALPLWRRLHSYGVPAGQPAAGWLATVVIFAEAFIRIRVRIRILLHVYQAHQTVGSRIFSRFWIDILMNND